jgi:hypothetical protein
MVRILGSTGTRRRRTWLAFGTAAALTFLAIPATSFANLAGSTFEGNDGNLVVNTSGNTDWANVAGLNAGIDLASGGGDNSFGQGTKEDDANVSVVSGSIPPQKSDLTRFYEASESISGQTYLYLAWERTNVLGSANMDFEINQAATPNLGSPGPHTINRTAGDLLVTYDFTKGGTTPTLGLNTWLTSASTPVVPGFATNVCLSSNSFPCWGDHIALNAANSEGAINTVTVTDPIAPNAPRSLAALTFGEAAINLTNSGVFPPGVCKAFGSAFLKSRASASFPAEVKDFVAPVPVNISNCGTLIVKKVTDPSPDPTSTSFGFTVDGPNPPNTNLPKSFNLTDGQSNSTQVFAGTSFSAAETVPTNWTLVSATCDNGSGSLVGSTISNISVAADETVTCTFTDKLQLGAIKITKKTSKAAATPLAGAVFSIKSGGNPISGSPFTTGNDGTICVDNLPFGTYSVQETAAPAGYKIDDTTAHDVTVSESSTCGDGHEATFSATDTPLTDLTVHVASEVTGGTQSSISCVDSLGNPIGDSPQPASGMGDPETVTANGLTPDTYTCTVVIDP